jgi:hypothetical protein
MSTYTFSFAIGEGFKTNAASYQNVSSAGYSYPSSAYTLLGNNLGVTFNSGAENNVFYQETLYTYNVYSPSCVGSNPIGYATARKIANSSIGLSQPIYNFTFNVFLTKNEEVSAPSGAQLTLNIPATGIAGYYNTSGAVSSYWNSPEIVPADNDILDGPTDFQNVPIEVPGSGSAVTCIDPITGNPTTVQPSEPTVSGTVVGVLSDGVYQNSIGTFSKTLNITGNPIYTVTLRTVV